MKEQIPEDQSLEKNFLSAMIFLLALVCCSFFSVFFILTFLKWGESYSHNMSEVYETLKIFSFMDP